MDEITVSDVKEAIATIYGVGTPREFDRLVEEGAYGDETWRGPNGDDLASYCHAVNVIAKFHGIDLVGKNSLEVMEWAYA